MNVNKPTKTSSAQSENSGKTDKRYLNQYKQLSRTTPMKLKQALLKQEHWCCK